MKRITLVMILLCVLLPVSLHADERLSNIQALTIQIKDSSAPVKRGTLENIATITYEVLLNVPLVGLEDNLTEVEGLIGLRNALEAYAGLSERLLAAKMQEAIDRMLLVEVTRRAVHVIGRRVTPPYKIDSLNLKTVSTLLKENEIAEKETIQYIQTLNGQFVKFCQAKNFNVEDFLDGTVARSLIPDLKKFMEEIQEMVVFIPVEKDSMSIEDFLFVYLLTGIDHAIDVRILCDILFDGLPASPKRFYEQIDQKLIPHSDIRVSSGLPNNSREVYATMSKILGNLRPEHYPITLTYLFLPYFSEPRANAAKFDEIFFRYIGEHGRFSRLMGL